MQEHESALLYVGLGGAVLIGVLALRATSTTSTPVSSPNSTAAINGIVAANQTAMTLQAQNQQAALNDGTTLETAVLSANQTIGLANLQAMLQSQQGTLAENANELNYATALDTNASAVQEAQAQATATTAQTQIAADASVASANASAQASEANANAATTIGVASANAQKSAANATANGNIFSSLIGGIAKVFA